MAIGEKAAFRQLEENGGVITRAEALALGFSQSTLSRRVDAGYLVKVGRGIYAQPGVLKHELGLLRAATSALDAVASHESAARLHRLDADRLPNVTISVPTRRSNRFAGVTVHQLTDLSRKEIVLVDDIPTTDPTRTFIDLAAVLPKRILADLMDQAVRMNLTSYDRIGERLEQLARKGKPGVVKMRSILKVRMSGPAVVESTLERRLLDLIIEAGLPKPNTQYRPKWLRKVNGRVDMAYVEEEIVIEADSIRFHRTPESFQLDRRRDNLAQLAGWILLRFTWEDITKRPGETVSIIGEALSQRSRYQI